MPLIRCSGDGPGEGKKQQHCQLARSAAANKTAGVVLDESSGWEPLAAWPALALGSNGTGTTLHSLERVIA